MRPAHALPAAIAAEAGFHHRLRVYWEDTDAGGIVFYANYLKFFERARTEWLRRIGPSQEWLRTERGLMFVVAETQVRYLRPARLDDRLSISVRRVEAGRVGMVVDQAAWLLPADAGADTAPDGPPPADAPRLAEGRIRIACVDAGTFRPCRIPTDLLDAFADLP
ncbi:YbgC/FadM family acyl-CoA thioesterase [Piscinibacter sakaiensis]|uniref:4-hydroxybenzoyl-CoA thioesterase family active site n=1 Tax=Piscinibacter sakaiensis TaxID=1547922 RepID=A0A0K8P2J7_PISS1|nr:YbgC/FadM family acyl-CoA thioesterase [Piscinibacter sakaiensis]GAP36897.1 4-hydroxybenzoyl-CoA thioesterase family active site [Piscinibacter sakaiensis]